MSIISMQKNLLALGLLLLTGCAGLNSSWNTSPTSPTPPPATYTQSDFDELLAFGSNMADITASARTDVCRMLLKPQSSPPGTSIWLHLMIGRLVSDSCGDIAKILDGIHAIPPGSLGDQRIQKLIDLDTEILTRMNATPRKSGSGNNKQKSAKPSPETKDTPETKPDETRLLREKLEAIRSMEKHLDESGGN